MVFLKFGTLPLNLSDPYLDRISSRERDEWLSSAMCRQIAFVRFTVPFWRDRLSAVNDRDIATLADICRIPILTKEELRGALPAALLPMHTLLDLRINRWTSGTSGPPTVNFWSETDWAALVASTSRMLERQAPMRAPVAFNVYSQSHVTGPLYSAALRQIGGVVYERSHHPEDIFSTLNQADLFEFDTLVLPARATRGKGIGLVDLLEQDSKFLKRHKVRWWIGSSGTFDQQIVSKACDQGVEIASNLYGSSEFALFAISCPEKDGDFHVAQGHVLAEVVDDSGNAVREGESGKIVVTHLCGMDTKGQDVAHTGTQIIRLAAGDCAKIHYDPCSCGLTTPRLREIQRIQAAA
jgi:phenylacetate-CoA ligase